MEVAHIRIVFIFEKADENGAAADIQLIHVGVLGSERAHIGQIAQGEGEGNLDAENVQSKKLRIIAYIQLADVSVVTLQHFQDFEGAHVQLSEVGAGNIQILQRGAAAYVDFMEVMVCEDRLPQHRQIAQHDGVQPRADILTLAVDKHNIGHSDRTQFPVLAEINIAADIRHRVGPQSAQIGEVLDAVQRGNAVLPGVVFGEVDVPCGVDLVRAQDIVAVAVPGLLDILTEACIREMLPINGDAPVCIGRGGEPHSKAQEQSKA